MSLYRIRDIPIRLLKFAWDQIKKAVSNTPQAIDVDTNGNVTVDGKNGTERKEP